jgi:putative heme degradation protein
MYTHTHTNTHTHIQKRDDRGRDVSLKFYAACGTCTLKVYYLVWLDCQKATYQ